jgi:hypothetical protein
VLVERAQPFSDKLRVVGVHGPNKGHRRVSFFDELPIAFHKRASQKPRRMLATEHDRAVVEQTVLVGIAVEFDGSALAESFAYESHGVLSYGGIA